MTYDPGHLLPLDAWERVVEAAEGGPPSAVAGVRRLSVPAYTKGGQMPGRPKILTVHAAETPLRVGYAESIARNWFATSDAGTSAHKMIDPRTIVTMLPDTIIAYHCGKGNTRSLGYEQAGYSHFTRAQWTTEAGMDQLDLLAGELAADCRAYGIPARWATDAQIRTAHAGGAAAGLATHDDMRRAVGGTSHTDPMPNYPKGLLLEAVRHLLGTPTPAPTPTPEDDVTPAQIEAVSDKAAAKAYAKLHPEIALVLHGSEDGHVGIDQLNARLVNLEPKLVTADGRTIYLVTPATGAVHVVNQTELAAWRKVGVVDRDEAIITVSADELAALVTSAAARR